MPAAWHLTHAQFVGNDDGGRALPGYASNAGLLFFLLLLLVVIVVLAAFVFDAATGCCQRCPRRHATPHSRIARRVHIRGTHARVLE